MPGRTLPQFDNLDRYGDSLNPVGTSAYGKDGGSISLPNDDAAKITISASETTKPDIIGANNKTGPMTPLQPVSLPTMVADAPETGAFLGTNLHPEGYLNPLNPHVSTEAQGKSMRLRATPYRSGR